MRLKYFLVAVLPLALATTSCKKQLDLKDPQGLDPVTALSTDANIKKVLQGGYDVMSSGNLYGGNIQIMSDLMASGGELQWVGTFNTYRDIWGKNISTTNPLVSGLWISAYSAISVANNVLSSVDKVAAKDKNRVEGEALFIRAAMHFELVRFFAKDYSDGNPSTNPGVPIVTKATNSTDEIEKPARNTVAEVYAAVIADLTKAVTLLPESNTVFATKTAAGAILSRVYLQKGDYAAAANAANAAINNASDFYLLDDWMANFNQGTNTPEDVFAMQVSDQDGTNNMQLFYSVDIFGARDGDIEVNSSQLALYAKNDFRRSVTTDPEDANFATGYYDYNGAYRTTKFRDIYKNVKVIRLAELYLTRAEANFRNNSAIGDSPLNDYNAIHAGARTGLAEATSITLDDIQKERRRELAFEGFGLHDAKRFKRTVDGLPWNSNYLVLPIPFREMNANSNLVQNPGYQ